MDRLENTIRQEVRIMGRPMEDKDVFEGPLTERIETLPSSREQTRYYCPLCGDEIKENNFRKGEFDCYYNCKQTFLTPIVEVRVYKDAMDIQYTASRTVSEVIRTVPWNPICFGGPLRAVPDDLEYYESSSNALESSQETRLK
jgi:hypothetical protein